MPSNNELEKGVLYVVPTPIGNLSDITLRARETLENCDFIAAEDTRVSGKLLMLLGIKKPMVSYHEHNKISEGKKICGRLKNGETCALVTDAGTPAVSDPGAELVALCAENGIKVISLPGACAAVTALAGSGIPSRRFCFEGFLPENASERREYLESIKYEKRTLIYYIAPHDLDRAIAELSGALGNRKCVLAKELTKRNEKYFYTTLGELPALLAAADPAVKKGEFVLIVAGASEDADADWKQLTVEEHILRYLKLGMTKMEACKAVARDRGRPKGEIYKIASEMNIETDG
ncbi:MAG TPA: 16S rRNA (cytidine(1402)-2'-O)-methyltransferase [Bacillota bacterium]|nr:16S rRNA (cytidine(1402)-2'-O)-methyltransferase [Bacillota bacterium]HOK68292.1 16S rRNA (cytidine(1402)-2'-O)-methyltransferase [Bacillota bacterium]HPP84506.1 16S rRNA (cytidine(1402)-2'-O)-methyltransferase [Bacillota bacterium]